MQRQLLIYTTLILFAAFACKSNSESAPTDSPGGSSQSASAPATALWAKTVTAAGNESQLHAITIDGSSNIFAAGYQNNTGSFSYASGVSATGASTSTNPVLVKYDSAGNATWARSTSTGVGTAAFSGAATDSSGNIIAVGYQTGAVAYTFAAGVSATGPYSSGSNIVMVKYDSSGTALWARSATAGTNQSAFGAVATDSTGNIYAVGYQFGTGTFTYGTGVSVTGIQNDVNAVIVKYDGTGTALWAKAATAGPGGSRFNGVATDSSGNVYAVGYQYGGTSFTYDTGVTATGAHGTSNMVIVKYNSAGVAQWARSTTAASSTSELKATVTDSAGNIYVAGFQNSIGTFGYGVGVEATGPSTSSNALLVKYDSAGSAQWARTVSSASSNSMYLALSLDTSGNVWTAGYLGGNAAYSFGAGVSTTATHNGENVVLVKYNSSGSVQSANTVTGGNGASRFSGVGADSAGKIYVSGCQRYGGTYVYGSGVSATSPYAGSFNAAVVKYQ